MKKKVTTKMSIDFLTGRNLTKYLPKKVRAYCHQNGIKSIIAFLANADFKNITENNLFTKDEYEAFNKLIFDMRCDGTFIKLTEEKIKKNKDANEEAEIRLEFAKQILGRYRRLNRKKFD